MTEWVWGWGRTQIGMDSHSFSKPHECQPGARHWLWEAVGQDGGWMWGWMFSVLASRFRVFLTSRAPVVLLLPVPSTVTTWSYCAACSALCPGVSALLQMSRGPQGTITSLHPPGLCHTGHWSIAFSLLTQLLSHWLALLVRIKPTPQPEFPSLLETHHP